MRLEIININKVSRADININGLTVIAGANSTGKSTIAKTFYSMIKSVAAASDKSEEGRLAKLDKQIATIYQRLKGKFNRSEDAVLDSLFPFPVKKFREQVLEAFDGGKSAVESFVNRRLEAIDKLDVTPRMKVLLGQDLENITIAMNDNAAADLAVELRYFIESEFMNKICSQNTSKSEVNLIMDETDSHVLTNLKHDEVSAVKGKIVEPLEDATYVESPLYIHILDAMLNAPTFRELGGRRRKAMIPIHIKDFAEKVDSMKFVDDEFVENVQQKLATAMEGSFVYDKSSKRLVFNTKGMNLNPLNVASGIKSLGILQMFIQTNVVNHNKLLIWDEPENHLHPEWQVLYADIFVQLTKKAGIPILLSTHSPYFLQAIRYFSAKYGVEKYVNYYTSKPDKENPEQFEYYQCNDRLGDVFSTLTTPLGEIMNVDAVRNSGEQ